MICCFEDCPDYSPNAEETELCAACNKEFSLAHLTDTVEEIDRALQAVDWRYCMESLQKIDARNLEIRQVKELFEQLENARDLLKQRLIVASA